MCLVLCACVFVISSDYHNAYNSNNNNNHSQHHHQQHQSHHHTSNTTNNNLHAISMSLTSPSRAPISTQHHSAPLPLPPAGGGGSVGVYLPSILNLSKSNKKV